MCPAEKGERWAQPGDEAMVGWDGKDIDPTADEALAGDQAAAAARRQAALDREAQDGFRTCPRCGERVDERLKRCPVCDALVVPTSRCPVCGAQVDDMTSYCPDCGTPNPRFKREFEL